jgi:hypothetical protein
MIIKSGLEDAKTKLIYFAGENNEESKKLNQSTAKLLGLYESNNTKALTKKTDEAMIENKKIIENNNKYINIINRTIEKHVDESVDRTKAFEKIGE